MSLSISVESMSGVSNTYCSEVTSRSYEETGKKFITPVSRSLPFFNKDIICLIKLSMKSHYFFNRDEFNIHMAKMTQFENILSFKFYNDFNFHRTTII